MLKKVRKRDKRVKRHKRLIERWHKLFVDSKYREYYKPSKLTKKH